GDFYVDPHAPSRFYLPSEDQRYYGEVAVLVGPSCSSACEFFAYDMSLEDRAAIVGQYPTGGMGGGVEDFAMPEGQFVRMPVVRSLDVDGNIIVEGPGVVPTVQAPVTLESLISADDVVLEAAVEHLDSVFGAPPEDLVVQDAGEIAVGDEVTGEIDQDERIRYTLVAEEDVTVTITLDGEDDSVDPYLRIYDADENLLAENDDIQLGVQINSRIEDFSLSADETIIIEVGTYDDGSSGTYTLAVSEAASE